MQPEAKEHAEVLSAKTPTEVVIGLLDNRTVSFTYSEHYGVELTFQPDGTVHIKDQEREYTLQPAEDDGSTLSEFVANIRNVEVKTAKVLPSIPKGNLQDTFGGLKGLIEAYLKVENAEGYHQAEPESDLKDENAVRDAVNKILS